MGLQFGNNPLKNKITDISIGCVTNKYNYNFFPSWVSLLALMENVRFAGYELLCIRLSKIKSSHCSFFKETQCTSGQ